MGKQKYGLDLGSAYDTKLGSRYSIQRHTAAKRGIPFLLTYEQWIRIWIDSGHLRERGKKVGQYCMARFGDKGAYEIGNVEIILRTDNSRTMSQEAKNKISSKRTERAKILIDYLGNAMTIPQAIYASGNIISTGHVIDRLRLGWPHREAVEVSVSNLNRRGRPTIRLG